MTCKSKEAIYVTIRTNEINSKNNKFLIKIGTNMNLVRKLLFGNIYTEFKNFKLLKIIKY